MFIANCALLKLYHNQGNARLTMMRGHYNMTNEKFEQAEKLEKDNNWPEALVLYKELASLEPNNSDILEKVAWCQSRLRYHDEAINTLKLLIGMNPNKAMWPYMIGYQYYDQKDYSNAMEWFRKALQIYPDYIVVKYRLGYALTQVCGSMHRLKKPEYLEAFKQFEECKVLWDKMNLNVKIKNKKLYSDVCFQQGKIYMERRDFVSAIDDFKKSIQYRQSSEGQYELAKALCENGQYNEALKFLPRDTSKYYVAELEAEIYSNNDNVDKALTILLECSKRRSRDYIFRRISELYIKNKDYKSAFKHAKKAISVDPKNHKNHMNLANILFELGVLIIAKKEAETASDLKKHLYETEYDEANQLLTLINAQIETSGYLKDDEGIIAQLQSDIQDNKNLNLKGKIKKYNYQRGFGFIESNSDSYFFHFKDVNRTQRDIIKEDQTVSFRGIMGDKGLAAKDVIIIL